jgi:hypothetical protein
MYNPEASLAEQKLSFEARQKLIEQRLDFEVRDRQALQKLGALALECANADLLFIPEQR